MRKIEFNIGDIVKVRGDLGLGERYGESFFVPPMNHYYGKEATIKNVLSPTLFQIEGSDCYWTIQMFEQKENDNMTKKDLRKGDVLVRRDGEVRIFIDHDNWRFAKGSVSAYTSDDYIDNLLANDSADYLDIIEVRRSTGEPAYKVLDGKLYEITQLETIWKREEKVKMTKAECEQRLRELGKFGVDKELEIIV